jgi:predicted nucleic acid-binding protein
VRLAEWSVTNARLRSPGRRRGGSGPRRCAPAQEARAAAAPADDRPPRPRTAHSGSPRSCAELAEQYASLRLDLIDASIVAVAERLGLTTLATLNRRDFTVVRPRHADAFELLP